MISTAQRQHITASTVSDSSVTTVSPNAASSPITTRWTQHRGLAENEPAPVLQLVRASPESVRDQEPRGRVGANRQPADKEPSPANGSETETLSRVLQLDEDETTRHVRALSRSLVQAVIEVLGGSRSASQLSRWMDPGVFEAVRLRAALGHKARLNTPSSAAVHNVYRLTTVRSVRACRISENLYEMALVVSDPRRCRALALRLERRNSGWKVTALHLW